MRTEVSIRKRLLVGLSSAILLTWLLAIGIAYMTTAKEVEEVYDASLVQYARVLATLMLHEAQEESNVRDKLSQVVNELGENTIRENSPLLNKLIRQYMQPRSNGDYLSFATMQPNTGHPYESKIAFVIQAEGGRVLLRSAADTPFQDFVQGFRVIRHRGDKWRVFNVIEPTKNLRVMVGERLQIRSEIQRLILVGGLWPVLVAFPVIALMVWGVVSRGLQPIQVLTHRISERSAASLEAIPETDVPSEVMPMIRALNSLFRRLTQAMENERNFTANAAHELRTPLAALKTNVQVLELTAKGESRKTITDILAGIESASHLLEQLLTLARTDATSKEMLSQQPVDIVSISRMTISDVSAQAFDKEIELSFDTDAEKLLFRGDAVLLGTMLRNLLDNAIRYTPAGGNVAVEIESTTANVHLRVKDNGPGIAAEQIEQLFHRFQRGDANHVSGSGLGLSIVKQIAYLHSISISLSEAYAGKGLCVELVFPQGKI